MFHRLKFDVTFPTGRRFQRDLSFTNGLTAIVGPNESGKSLILEMLRYALFGSAALRGSADDYKTLSVTCEFEVRGERYTVERTARKAELRGAVKASGTTAVNAAIVELLGFGIAVFDVACSINQGEVEQLGRMKPAERKRLVDGVLGIGALDIVTKWSMEEARLLEKEVEVIETRLVKPVAPEKPQDYESSASFDLETLRAQTRERDQLQGLVNAPVSRPLKPETTITQTEDELKRIVEIQDEADRLRARIAVLPQASREITATPLDWDRFDLWDQAQKWLSANPAPAVDADAMLEAHDVRDLMERLERAKSQGGLTCPECSAHVPHAHDEIQKLEAELAGRTAERPSLSRAELARVKAYDWLTYEAMSETPAAERPPMTRSEIAAAEAEAEQVKQRLALEEQLASLPPVDIDARSALVTLRHEQRLLTDYKRLLADFEVWSEKVAAAVRRLEELKDLPDLAGVERRFHEAVTYERALTAFDAAMSVWMTDRDRVETLKASAKEYRLVKETMQTLRVLIKQHLLPSLNAVASQMLIEMTAGERASIHVDDDFEITVDGQPLETLSGSGKACANLALRIGLGQVLTNRVFSSLLADEVDESMDLNRATNTSKLLVHLQKHISQVLLVSHKSIEAPTLIDLGVSVDLQRRGTEEAA